MCGGGAKPRRSGLASYRSRVNADFKNCSRGVRAVLRPVACAARRLLHLSSLVFCIPLVARFHHCRTFSITLHSATKQHFGRVEVIEVTSRDSINCRFSKNVLLISSAVGCLPTNAPRLTF